MSEMVERVARAICVKNCEDPDEASYGFLGTGDPKSFAWRGYIPHAIAAITALREPTDDVAEHAAYQIAKWEEPNMGLSWCMNAANRDRCKKLARIAINAVIDEALK